MKGLRVALSAFASVLFGFAGLATWPGATPAAADTQAPFKLKAPSSETRSYDALVGTDPANQNCCTRNPSHCASVSYCDTIQVELSVPSDLKNSDTEDYFLRLKIEWSTSAGSNVHAYLYDAPYKGEFPIASSATANMPETINLYRPEKPQYLLVITNVNGVNPGYKVTAAITVEPFGGAPDFGGVSEKPNRPPDSSPPPPSDDNDDFEFDDSSGDSSFTPPPAVDSGSGPPPPLADVEQDESLSALARGRGEFANSLTAPDFTLKEQEPPPPGPVSGATVALLGGLLPASIVGGGVFWLRRKGGTASAGF